MICSVHGGFRGVNVLDADNAHPNADGFQDELRPVARKPVLHSAGAVEDGSDERHRPQHTGVKVDDGDKEEVRTQPAEQRVPLLGEGRDGLVSFVHRRAAGPRLAFSN